MYAHHLRQWPSKHCQRYLGLERLVRHAHLHTIHTTFRGSAVSLVRDGWKNRLLIRLRARSEKPNSGPRGRLFVNKVTLTADCTLLWYCPGCKCDHGVPVVGGRAWGWNNSLTNPTITPSVLVHSHPRHEQPDQPRCHCYVHNGLIVFLSDCTHEFVGRTVEMEVSE